MFDEIGISTWACAGMPVAEALGVIEKAGFSVIEVWGDDPQHFDPEDGEDVKGLAATLSSSSLVAGSLHAPFGGEMDISAPDPRARKRAVARSKAVVVSASRIPAKAVVLHPGGAMRVGELPERYRAAATSLEEIGALAEDVGVELYVENMVSAGAVDSVFCDTLPKLLHLVRSVKDHPPGICVDTGHAQITGRVAEEIEICGDTVKTTHISDNGGHRDEHLPPGDGVVDWNSVFTSLQRVGYSGPMMLEVFGGEAPEEVISRSRSSLSGLIASWRG